MRRATAVKARGTWTGDAAGAVVLEYDERHRRRMAMATVGGSEFLLDLAETVVLRGGDALVLDDGGLIEVVSAPEPLAEIRSASQAELVRVAWHLGNRHLATQIVGGKLRIRRDHVIEAMARGLGAKVIEIEAPFDPEGGAYAAGPQPHPHGAHDHGHAHDAGRHPHVHEHGGDGHDHDAHGARHHDPGRESR